VNTRLSPIVLFSVALALLLFGSRTLADNGPEFLFATGQEITANVIDPGTATCIGGQATGDPYDPCLGSHRVMLDHQVVEAVVLSATGAAAPLLGGTNTITADCNLDGNLRGRCYGTFEWQVDANSVWTGTLNGEFDFWTFEITFQLVGTGSGGIVDGMQLHYDAYYDGGYDFTGDFVARVHAPKN